MQEVSIAELENMPTHQEASALALYLIGCDLRKVFDRTTFFRRKKALKKYGFDISKRVDNPVKVYTVNVTERIGIAP